MLEIGSCGQGETRVLTAQRFARIQFLASGCRTLYTAPDNNTVVLGTTLTNQKFVWMNAHGPAALQGQYTSVAMWAPIPSTPDGQVIAQTPRAIPMTTGLSAVHAGGDFAHLGLSRR